MSRERPKIGLALSGGSGRAIAHIGVLEVLTDHKIPLDYVTACSSGALIASSYACGTLPALKRDWMKINKKFLYDRFELGKSGTGVFRMEKMAEWFTQYTQNKKFEDVKPHLGFVCTDILTGEPITLSLGDLTRACLASCAVPGLLEPVTWGNRLLVDGGLFSIVPTTQAKEMGADFVIGVDIASTRYLFKQKVLRMRKGYNFLRRSWPVRIYIRIHEALERIFTKSIDFIFYNQSDVLEDGGLSQPGMFGILGRAIDISIAQTEKHDEVLQDCDFVISPQVKHMGKIDFASAEEMLLEGRKAAEAAIPEIQKLLRDWQLRQKLEATLKTAKL